MILSQRLIQSFDPVASGEFQLHECGYLDDMSHWQHQALGGPFWRLYHNTEPGIVIGIGKRRLPLLPGEIVLIPEGISFRGAGVAGVSHHWIHFSPPMAVSPAPRLFRLRLDPALAAQVVDWEEGLRSGEGKRGGVALSHRCVALLHACFARLPLRKGKPMPPALLRVLERIERSLAAPPGNPALAREAGMSVEGFIRWFRQRIGTTPARYVARRRIREASRLLMLTDRSVDEVAAAVGFANRHHFSRVFRRCSGDAPAHFRNARRRDRIGVPDSS